MEGKCTVYFSDPFWVGVFERSDEHGYAIARFVFGAEPGDAELHRFALEEFARLEFSAPGPAPEATPDQANFKRRMREARKQTRQTGVGTWAQRAMQSEWERQKQTRQEERQANREEAERADFLRKQMHKKEKHKGH
jgi:hypothetical protein